MRYVSTRGAAPEVGFTDALLAGMAPDGGLYTPRVWPRLAAADIAGFAERPYAEVAARILALFAGEDIPRPVLEAVCAAAYSRFDHIAVAPLVQLAPARFVLELFHGPTLAFKDIAMQVLGGLFAHALERRSRTMTVVAATSGDTGGAAAVAFAGVPGVRLIILYPEGRISAVQRRFMTTTGADNVRCLAIGADFDACQAMMKALFADHAFARETGLAAVNSVNIARIAAQCVYYFTAGAALGAPGREIAFAVPTGNFGDAYAGWATRAMGLPVRRIIAATNANAMIAKALCEGIYRRGPAVETQSPAMDIQAASNFERLHFEHAGRGNLETAQAFEAFARTGEISLTPALRAALGEVFDGASASEADTAQAMRRAWRESGMLIDPHTAVALSAAERSTWQGAPMVVLSTAHPAKFPDAVLAATGQAPLDPPAVAKLAGLRERLEPMAPDVEALKGYVRAWS
ncbi:MAG TPA: threonine synthase [Caulobacteraceae bacterium]|jgi:threonine synthase|nr:threonine synthase [Caulobacteraceae bacterium]